MKRPGPRFRALPHRYPVCRLPAQSVVPAWAVGPFLNITFTEDEVAIICPTENVPMTVRAERNWRVLKFVGPSSFNAIRVLASLAPPLARARISLLPITTYDPDYSWVKTEVFEDAIAVRQVAGHTRI